MDEPSIELEPFTYNGRDYPAEDQQIVEVPKPLEQHYRQYTHYLVRSRMVETLAYLDNLLGHTIPKESNFFAYRAVIHLLKARLHHRMGNYCEAEEDYVKAVNLGNACGFPVVQVSAAISLGLLYLAQSHFTLAETTLKAARSLLENTNGLFLTKRLKEWRLSRQVNLLTAESRLFTRRRQFSWSEARIQELRKLAERHKDPSINASLHEAEGLLSYHQGNFGHSIEQYQTALGHGYELSGAKASVLFQLEVGLVEALTALYSIQKETHQLKQLEEVLERLEIFAKDNLLLSSLPSIAIVQATLFLEERFDWQAAMDKLNETDEFLTQVSLQENSPAIVEVREFRIAVEKEAVRWRAQARKEPKTDIQAYLRQMKAAVQGLL